MIANHTNEELEAEIKTIERCLFYLNKTKNNLSFVLNDLDSQIKENEVLLSTIKLRIKSKNLK